MRFEARDLKTYAEPVSASDLREETVYFFLNYIDDQLLIPELTPVVFIGKNLHEGDSGTVYFQDAGSYRAGVRHSSSEARENAVFHSGSENQVNHVFEYENALNLLLLCSIRRQREGNTLP